MNDLTRLPHRLNADLGTCRAVVEAPKGRRSKYDSDPELGAFVLAGFLPEGMGFPLDLGFIPSTKAENGDPLEVMVLADEPTAMSGVVDLRLIGVIEAEQTEGDETVRIARRLSVACVSKLYQQTHGIGHLQEY